MNRPEDMLIDLLSEVIPVVVVQHIFRCEATDFARPLRDAVRAHQWPGVGARPQHEIDLCKCIDAWERGDLESVADLLATMHDAMGSEASS